MSSHRSGENASSAVFNSHEVNLSYAELEAMLVAVLRVPEGARMRLRSRIQHLQRAQFPPGANVGRGARHRYDREDSFQVLFAFVLMDIGWTSLAAAHFLIEQWANFDLLIDDGLSGSLTSNRTLDGWLLLNPNTLSSISPGLTDRPATQHFSSQSAAQAASLAGCVINVAEIARVAGAYLKARRCNEQGCDAIAHPLRKSSRSA